MMTFDEIKCPTCGLVEGVEGQGLVQVPLNQRYDAQGGAVWEEMAAHPDRLGLWTFTCPHDHTWQADYGSGTR